MGMNSSTKDKVEGTIKETVGKAKEATGKAIGNPDLQDRGTVEKVAGKVGAESGRREKSLWEIVSDVSTFQTSSFTCAGSTIGTSDKCYGWVCAWDRMMGQT